MHKVKCKYCQETFDRDKEPFVKVSERRYAHKLCFEQNQAEKTQEEKDLEALEQYIMNLFSEQYIGPRIRKQIKEYKENYNYSYSGMLKTLIWWFEVKGNSVEKANGGIGIIPYIYQQACDYYYALFLAKKANENKDLSYLNKNTKTIHIKPPSTNVKSHKLFQI